MLRREHHILRSRTHKQIRPLVRIEELCPELRRKVLVGVAGALLLLVECPGPLFHSIGFGVVAAFAHLVPVPLRVGQLAWNHRRIRRHRVNAPMDEDAEFCVREPRWSRPLVDRLPGRLIALRKEADRSACEEQERNNQRKDQRLAQVHSIAPRDSNRILLIRHRFHAILSLLRRMAGRNDRWRRRAVYLRQRSGSFASVLATSASHSSSLCDAARSLLIGLQNRLAFRNANAAAVGIARQYAIVRNQRIESLGHRLLRSKKQWSRVLHQAHSDCPQLLERKQGTLATRNLVEEQRLVGTASNPHQGLNGVNAIHHQYIRSEERRVGKECRSRWRPY